MGPLTLGDWARITLRPAHRAVAVLSSESPSLRTRSGSAFCARGCWWRQTGGVVEGSGGLFFGFDLVEGDGVAEGFELALEATGAVLD